MATIKIQDLTNAGFCNHAGRDFAKKHGLNWRHFLQNGIDSKNLPPESLSDVNVQIVIAEAENRERNERG